MLNHLAIVKNEKWYDALDGERFYCAHLRSARAFAKRRIAKNANRSVRIYALVETVSGRSIEED